MPCSMSAKSGWPWRAFLVRKRAGDELSKSAPDSVLSRFIVAELQRLKALGDPEDAMGDLDELDIFFPALRLEVVADHVWPISSLEGWQLLPGCNSSHKERTPLPG